MVAYAQPSDVYALALPSQAFKPTPKTIEATTIATGVLTLSSNGLSNGALLRFSVEGQSAFGATANALPGGLALASMYAASQYQGSGDLFRVTPVGGALITSFSSEPVGPFAIVVDIAAAVTAQLEAWARIIDDALIAHETPIEVDPATGAFPYKLTFANAHLAARTFATALGLNNPQYAASMAEFTGGSIAKMVDGWLTDWKAGAPLYPNPVAQSDVAFDAARASRCAPMPWIRRTL